MIKCLSCRFFRNQCLFCLLICKEQLVYVGGIFYSHQISSKGHIQLFVQQICLCILAINELWVWNIFGGLSDFTVTSGLAVLLVTQVMLLRFSHSFKMSSRWFILPFSLHWCLENWLKILQWFKHVLLKEAHEKRNRFPDHSALKSYVSIVVFADN